MTLAVVGKKKTLSLRESPLLLLLQSKGEKPMSNFEEKNLRQILEKKSTWQWARTGLTLGKKRKASINDGRPLSPKRRVLPQST